MKHLLRRLAPSLAASIAMIGGPALAEEPTLVTAPTPAYGEVAAPATPPTPLAIAVAPPAGATVRLTPNGQFMARFRHFEGHDFAPGNVMNAVTQRARAGLRMELGDVSAFVEIQDVRIWGEETDTLGDFSANGLDLHQGFVAVQLTDGLKLTVGRQEVNWLNQRLVGSVAWIEQARSLDAAHIAYVSADGAMTVNAMYARTRNGIAVDETRPEHFMGAMWQYKIDPAFVPALIAIIDLNGPTDRTRITAGLHATGALDFGLTYELEAYLQAGSIGDSDIMAYLLAFHARQTLKDFALKPYLELRAEVVSGDSDLSDNTTGSFDTLFATNHKFYGEMDFFLNLPANTSQRGLVDLAAEVGLRPHTNVSLALAGHVFQTAQSRGGPSDFGTELDLIMEWRPIKPLRLDFVYSAFIGGDAFTGGNANALVEHFVYSTAQVVF